MCLYLSLFCSFTFPLSLCLQDVILQALKDQILEGRQQKDYLDRLLCVVIDRAPGLLEVMEASTADEDSDTLSLKPRTLEFC